MHDLKNIIKGTYCLQGKWWIVCSCSRAGKLFEAILFRPLTQITAYITFVWWEIEGNFTWVEELLTKSTCALWDFDIFAVAVGKSIITAQEWGVDPYYNKCVFLKDSGHRQAGEDGIIEYKRRSINWNVVNWFIVIWMSSDVLAENAWAVIGADTLNVSRGLIYCKQPYPQNWKVDPETLWERRGKKKHSLGMPTSERIHGHCGILLHHISLAAAFFYPVGFVVWFPLMRVA